MICTQSTWIACTSLLLSSRAADAVEVPKDAAPLWRPRMMRPSFLYCSIGSQNKSLTPWTGQDEGERKYESQCNQQWKAAVKMLQKTKATYTAGRLSAWVRHLPGCRAADSSWCPSATLWRRTESLCRPRGDWNMQKVSESQTTNSKFRANYWKIAEMFACWFVLFLPVSAAEPLQFQLGAV